MGPQRPRSLGIQAITDIKEKEMKKKNKFYLLLPLGAALCWLSFGMRGGSISANNDLEIRSAPSNDQCGSATPAPIDNLLPITVNTSSATNTGDPKPSCVPTFANGVWYSFEPTSYGKLVVDTAGSSFDTALAIYFYTGDCTNRTEVGCNDTAAGGSRQAKLEYADIQPSKSYLILAGGNNSAGTLELDFSFTATPTCTLSKVSPDSGINTGPVNVTITGDGFDTTNPGTQVKLTKSGETIEGTDVAVVSATQIACTFDLTGKQVGNWDVIVVKPDQDTCISRAGSSGGGFLIVEDPNIIHDVAVTSLSASPNPASKGQKVTVTYTIKNKGTVTENGLTFQLSYGSTMLGQRQTVGSLDAGQETTKTMTVVVPKKQRSGDYLITGTVSKVPGETDTANSATVKVTVR